MTYDEMTVGLRVKTVRPTRYTPHLELDVPEGTTGTVEGIETEYKDEFADYNAVIVRLDQPLFHADREEFPDPITRLLIYRVAEDDRDWTNPDDFEPA